MARRLARLHRRTARPTLAGTVVPGARPKPHPKARPGASWLLRRLLRLRGRPTARRVESPRGYARLFPRSCVAARCHRSRHMGFPCRAYSRRASPRGAPRRSASRVRSASRALGRSATEVATSLAEVVPDTRRAVFEEVCSSPFAKLPLEGAFTEVSDSATRCLVGQLDTAVGSHREGRVPRHFPQDALGISEETVAPEEDLLCLLDYRGSSLGSFCEYLIHLPLFSHIVRQRDTREPAVLHIF